MMKYFFVFTIFILVFMACGGHEEKSAENNTTQVKVTNPNGMSEMSLIMEKWYQQLEVYTKQLKAGKMLDQFVELDHQKIYTAEVSKEKDNVHGEQFDAFTDAFFYNYDNIGKAQTFEEQVKHFNLAVTSCINCHEQHCQGPIVRIKKLKVQ